METVPARNIFLGKSVKIGPDKQRFNYKNVLILLIRNLAAENSSGAKCLGWFSKL
jgi:hypothetical protein